MKKQYEISVLVIESDEELIKLIEDTLETYGLSGRKLRSIAKNSDIAKELLNVNKYEFVIGNLPSGTQLQPWQIYLNAPNKDDENSYLEFLKELTGNLEAKFGFSYDSH